MGRLMGERKKREKKSKTATPAYKRNKWVHPGRSENDVEPNDLHYGKEGPQNAKNARL